jgi:hypothetical protein
MNSELDDYIPNLGDSAVEREVAQILRSNPEESRLAFIEKLIAFGDAKLFRTAFRLARSTLSGRDTALGFLAHGCEKADASTIRHWLEVASPLLGPRRLIQFFADRLPTDPVSVIKARYWLPTVLPSEGDASAEMLRRLDQMIADRVRGHADLEKWFAAMQN